MDRYHIEQLVPAFGLIPGELDPVEGWHSSLSNPLAEPEWAHVCLVLDIALGTPYDEETVTIAAGCSFEYATHSNVGLISYIIVDKRFQYYEGQVSGAVGLFAETNKDDGYLSLDAKTDVMNPKDRHKVLHALGFYWLDFDFVQPRVDEHEVVVENLHLIFRPNPCFEKQHQAIKFMSKLKNMDSSNNFAVFCYSAPPLAGCLSNVTSLPGCFIQGWLKDYWESLYGGEEEIYERMMGIMFGRFLLL